MTTESAPFEPNWFSPPGATIQAFMNRKNVSLTELSQSMGLEANEMRSLLLGDRSVDNVIAEKLAGFVGGSAEFWRSRQQDYSESLKRCAELSQDKLEGIKKGLPLREMRKRGWLTGHASESEQTLAFFGVSSADMWKNRYSDRISAVSFRQSETLEGNPNSTLVWLRQAERLASLVPCSAWDKDGFLTLLSELRSFTRRKYPSRFFPELVQKCSRLGVAVVFVSTPTGCRASGATFFSGPNKAVIVLSFRFLSDDQFWFSFFHEAGHLILHDQQALFLEDSSEVTVEAELEANKFASDLLVPPEYRPELESLPARSDAIIRFAVRLGISPGVVVGQMQHAGLIKHSQMNGLKRRFPREELARLI